MGYAAQNEEVLEEVLTEESVAPGDVVNREFTGGDGDVESDSFGMALSNRDGDGYLRCLEGEGFPIQQKADLIRHSNGYICSNDSDYQGDVFTFSNNQVMLHLGGDEVDGYCHVGIGETECNWVKPSSE